MGMDYLEFFVRVTSCIPLKDRAMIVFTAFIPMRIQEKYTRQEEIRSLRLSLGKKTIF